MHTTKVVKTEQLTDESIAVTIRCCDQPGTDSVLTIYQPHELTAEAISGAVNEHHDRVKDKCAGMQRALKSLEGLVNLSKEHEG